ncbi:MAG TPA: hypothetical protein VGM78_04765, partial [Ilumatobacteraceae bacterium]
MNPRAAQPALIAVAIGYLAFISWAMTHLSYDIWGAFIVIPPLGVIGAFGIRKLLGAELRPLTKIMILGLLAKLGGTAARYWIAFDAYGGASDSQQYHLLGSQAAAQVWHGTENIGSVIPLGTGTEFVVRCTAFMYTLIGSSKLAGFIVFAWLGYWGIIFFVKAAHLAVPGLATKRYALLLALAPSLVYWPAAIGKEALMMLGLGIGTYGIARLLTRRGVFGPLLLTAAGLGFTASVRPHIAGIWIAGTFPALLVALRRGDPRDGRGRGANRLVLLVVIAVAAVALGIVGTLTVRYLNGGA